MGLVVSRKKDEKIIIDGGITLTIVDIRNDKVRIKIDAPIETGIDRLEVWEAKQANPDKNKNPKSSNRKTPDSSGAIQEDTDVS